MRAWRRTGRKREGRVEKKIDELEMMIRDETKSLCLSKRSTICKNCIHGLGAATLWTRLICFLTRDSKSFFWTTKTKVVKEEKLLWRRETKEDENAFEKPDLKVATDNVQQRICWGNLAAPTQASVVSFRASSFHGDAERKSRENSGKTLIGFVMIRFDNNCSHVANWAAVGMEGVACLRLIVFH